MRKLCKLCGDDFVKVNHNQRYCSRECEKIQRKIDNDAKLRARPKKLCKHTCDECGIVFMKIIGVQRFCSPECRKCSLEKGSFKIFARDNFKCIYCGASSVHDQKSLEIEHIFPASKGGKDIASNLFTSCIDCNGEKNDSILDVKNFEILQKEVTKRNLESEILPNQIIKLRTKR